MLKKALLLGLQVIQTTGLAHHLVQGMLWACLHATLEPYHLEDQ